MTSMKVISYVTQNLNQTKQMKSLMNCLKNTKNKERTIKNLIKMMILMMRMSPWTRMKKRMTMMRKTSKTRSRRDHVKILQRLMLRKNKKYQAKMTEKKFIALYKNSQIKKITGSVIKTKDTICLATFPSQSQILRIYLIIKKLVFNGYITFGKTKKEVFQETIWDLERLFKLPPT